MRKLNKGKGIWQRLQSPIVITILIVILIFAVLICVGALRHSRDGETTALQRGLGSIVTWIQTGTSRLGDAVVHVFRGPYWNAETVEEYLTLKQEVASLRRENEQLDQIRDENERLLQLLDAQSMYQTYEPVFARVINRAQTAYSDVIVIDRGENDGIAVDMAVVSADGLVGRVSDVGKTWARVTCLLSNASSVPAMIEQTRDPGIVKGNLAQSDADRLLTMQYLPDGAIVTPGDRVLTSGMGGIFPKGILIGEVSSVDRSQSQLAGVVVAPAVDFVHLEEVFVLTSVGQQVPLTQEDDES